MEAKQAPALADFETTEYFFYLSYPGCTGEYLHYHDAHQPSLQKVHDLIHILKLKPISGVCGMDYITQI